MKLFEPITIRGMEIRNRIVMAPMGTTFGFRNKRARAFYAERARGGVGAITVALLPVDLFEDQDFVQGLGASLIDAIHEHGVKVGSQIWHGNKYPYSGENAELVAPSPGMPLWEKDVERVWYDGALGQCRELTIAEIEDIIAKFANAAARAKDAGFDFVEVHGCHGHSLAHQFFSPLGNRRRDRYGKDLAGRMRFNIEMAHAIRQAIGEDYPFFWRLSASEGPPGGITLSDAVELSKQLVKAGVDVIDVSFGAGIHDDAARVTKKQRMGTFAHLAEAVRQQIKAPVIAVGRINSHKVAEAILAKGQADMVAIGRQLLCDPFWPRKVREGRAREIVACDSCSECVDLAVAGEPMRCKKNGRLGREWELPAPE